MNVMTSPRSTSIPVRSSIPNPFKKNNNDEHRNWGDSFSPSSKKIAYGAAYLGAPLVAGLLSGNPAVTLGTSVVGAAAGVYAGRHMSGMDKAKLGLAGFFVANSAANIGAFAASPSLGGVVNLAISGLICYTSGTYLMQMSA